MQCRYQKICQKVAVDCQLCKGMHVHIMIAGTKKYNNLHVEKKLTKDTAMYTDQWMYIFSGAIMTK